MGMRFSDAGAHLSLLSIKPLDSLVLQSVDVSSHPDLFAY